MSDPDHFDDEELVSANTQQRNWRGILIALLVIIFVLALIVTSVVLLTPPDEGPRVRGARFKLHDILGHEFQAPRFNGTWISDHELVFRDQWGGISIMNADDLSVRSILTNHTFSQYNPARFILSPDQKYLLLACNTKKLFRYSFLAQYYIYDINTMEIYPLTTSSSEESQPPFLLHADWAPRGHALIMVHDYDIYYRPAPRSARAFRITDDAIPGVVSNGVPDWLYEEEILSSNVALWMSKDGHLLLHATFNDTLVQELKFPWYGVNEDLKLYPEIRSLRYPKPGTVNPTVSLYVSDLADLDNINTRELLPPQALSGVSDYYFSAASWISLTEVCVVWMNRPQNLSLVTVCKSPKWYCQETQRIGGEGKGWVEIFPPPIFSPDGSRYITLAPVRDGLAGFFRHIITVNIPKKRALPLTHGKFQVNKILAWDQNLSIVYYLGTPEMSPGQIHLYSVSSEPPNVGSPLPLPVCITCPTLNETLEYDSAFVIPQQEGKDSEWEDNWDISFSQHQSISMKAAKTKEFEEPEVGERPCSYHNAIFSPNLMYFVLECMGPGVPTTFLYTTRNYPQLPSLVTVLQNNTKLKEKLSKMAQPRIKTFGVQISGGYQAQVRLHLPPGLREDEITRYPLVVQVYSGPGTQLVTDRWKIDWSTFLASNKEYIIAQIDGRGSSGQGYQLMHEIYHRLGTVEVADQLEVTEYLRDSLHFIDKRRVAVWGWSYGGFVAALSLAKSSDLFHCAISVAPVTNWALYDSAYTERYMGLPNITDNYKGYEEADLSKWADGFRDKNFYLIHGTADDNVHFQQSMTFVKALIAKGVLFRLQIYADEKHTLGGVKLHLYKSMLNYLENCFRKSVPPDLKSGLRTGGIMEPTAI
ncbi:UNVERIFIED_CONTAM: hypothetical protein PYX00_004738 [Menopon gallinae]|uniref:Venom dipeptidyl peptidase 4 n=1 Tax=Menopon gallinae TaxID=328185 RepID=A0AAW2I5U5_9NEOP